MEFEGKNVLVLGAGISGMSVAKILQDFGAKVTLNDAKTQEALHKDFSEVSAAGVTLSLGYQDESLLEGKDYIILSPGISIYSPLVERAKEKNITVISEIEAAYRICRAPIIAITGTNGKTTTTTLVGEMLKTKGCPVVVGGNIGAALSHEVLNIKEDGLVAAEISSFQLEAIDRFHAHIAAILNITPDHIDRHRSMKNYAATKARIFANQTQEDFIILNYDDPIVKPMAANAKANVVFFSRSAALQEGIVVDNGVITIKWLKKSYPVCAVENMQIKGGHNVENALAACGMAFFAGVSIDNMAKILAEFPGVEHRIEPVKTINGVEYYNDSKATNPESSIKALEAFPGNIILIAGGRDKNTDLTEFMELIKKRVDHLILIGEAAARFKEAALKHHIENIHEPESFEAAVQKSYQLATPPQVVLLSPACASYDMFANYEERGRVFKELVNKLP